MTDYGEFATLLTAMFTEINIYIAIYCYSSHSRNEIYHSSCDCSGESLRNIHRKIGIEEVFKCRRFSKIENNDVHVNLIDQPMTETLIDGKITLAYFYGDTSLAIV